MESPQNREDSVRTPWGPWVGRLCILCLLGFRVFGFGQSLQCDSLDEKPQPKKKPIHRNKTLRMLRTRIPFLNGAMLQSKNIFFLKKKVPALKLASQRKQSSMISPILWPSFLRYHSPRSGASLQHLWKNPSGPEVQNSPVLGGLDAYVNPMCFTGYLKATNPSVHPSPSVWMVKQNLLTAKPA